MKLFADESVDKPIITKLRDKGFELLYAAEMSPGISDDKILAIANRESDLLLTADKDFGELIFQKHLFAKGIVLIRLAGISTTKKAEIVYNATKKYNSKMLNAFTVITSTIIRIRPF